MTIADHIFKILRYKTDVIFMITGGQAMYLNDALLRSGMKYICTHNEQAATMAAEAYARLSGKLGVALVTAGPGSINALNGVAGAYMDSAPVLILSGQSPRKYIDYMKRTEIRQHGIQGINIEPIVTPITKFFRTINFTEGFPTILEQAIEIAFDRRPGPVWLDFPLDVQSQII